MFDLDLQLKNLTSQVNPKEENSFIGKLMCNINNAPSPLKGVVRNF